MAKKLYVGNLSYQATETEIRELFSKHGTVNSVKVIMDRETNRPRGFCFVEMEDITTAMTALNGFDFKGRPLRVNEAQEQKPRQNFRDGNNGGGDRGNFRRDDRRDNYER